MNIQDLTLSGKRSLDLVILSYLTKDFKGDSLTTILLLWKVPNRHILETLTSTEKYVVWNIFFCLKGFQVLNMSKPYLLIRTEHVRKLKIVPIVKDRQVQNVTC